jgi:SMI1 / KNR4 family (SUKH-1)
MNSHVRRFYRTFVDEETPVRFYHQVIPLHEHPEMAWDEIQQKIPSFPKGWHELARLPAGDRIEFIQDYWLSTLPFVSHVHTSLQNFFSNLDDIGVYLTQSQIDSSFECEIVYSLRDDSSFFHGAPPSETQIELLKRTFNEALPDDYLAFLKVHDGFSKHSDTGIIRTKDLTSLYNQLQERIQNEMVYSGKTAVDPSDLIPFYEAFGEPSFQCFYLRWTPMKSPGNVYYSMAEGRISDVNDPSAWNQNLAFPTFLDWLIFYIEEVEE